MFLQLQNKNEPKKKNKALSLKKGKNPVLRSLSLFLYEIEISNRFRCGFLVVTVTRVELSLYSNRAVFQFFGDFVQELQERIALCERVFLLLLRPLDSVPSGEYLFCGVVKERMPVFPEKGAEEQKVSLVFTVTHLEPGVS